MKILISGASGFVGRHLVAKIAEEHSLQCLVRTPSADLEEFEQLQWHASLSAEKNALLNTDAVIHLAARAHVLKEESAHALASFREVNTQLTLDLAKAAVDSGVRRFIYVSTIGVNGQLTRGTAFSEGSPVAPVTDYGVSKWEAERGLQALASSSDMEVCIIRPPLVYAGHAPGNFARLLKLAESGIPLPFASIQNKRNMVALENLTDFISLCVKHPQAANETFVIADDEAVSLPTILQKLRFGMGIQPRLFACPTRLLEVATGMLGKRKLYEQICSDLEVNNLKAKELVGWRPVLKAQDALTEAGKQYKDFIK